LGPFSLNTITILSQAELAKSTRIAALAMIHVAIAKHSDDKLLNLNFCNG
jgi:hypothetical protein